MAANSSRPADAPDAARLPGARRDRRPVLLALAIVLVLVGAVGSALVAMSLGDRDDVLVAARDIAPGQEITAADFTTAQAGVDGGVVVPADALASFLGSYATSAIPQGSIVSPDMFITDSALPEGGEVIGLVLSPTQRPADPIAAGDVLRLYQAMGPEGGSASGQVLLEAARVVSSVDAGGTLSVSVLVSSAEAPAVVPSASAGQVAVTLLPPSTVPTIDFSS